MNETGIHEERGEGEIEAFDIGPAKILQVRSVILRSTHHFLVFIHLINVALLVGIFCRKKSPFMHILNIRN